MTLLETVGLLGLGLAVITPLSSAASSFVSRGKREERDKTMLLALNDIKASISRDGPDGLVDRRELTGIEQRNHEEHEALYGQIATVRSITSNNGEKLAAQGSTIMALDRRVAVVEQRP